ncbi:MAG: ECF transporter S component [Anaerolineae bacterium]
MNEYDRRIRRVITAGLLLAITLLLSLTRIGFIPVPTPAGNATINHIPAIIGGILEGPLVGLIVGFGFGVASFMSATVPMFKDPMVAVLPRLFIGLVSAWSYAALRRAGRRELTYLLGVLLALLLIFSYQIAGTTLWVGILVAVLSLAAAIAILLWMRHEDVRIVALAIVAAIGSLTNTVLVLTMATIKGYMAAGVALGVGLTHGIPEAIVSAIVVVAVVAALRQVGRRRQGSRL